MTKEELREVCTAVGIICEAWLVDVFTHGKVMGFRRRDVQEAIDEAVRAGNLTIMRAANGAMVIHWDGLTGCDIVASANATA